jgi:hypothetical protein
VPFYRPQKLLGESGLSLHCTKSFLRFAISVSCGSKNSMPHFLRGIFSAQLGDSTGELGVMPIFCVCLFSFFFATCTTRIMDTNEKNEKLRIRPDLSWLWVALQRSDLDERMDWDHNMRFFSALCSRGGLILGRLNGL